MFKFLLIFPTPALEKKFDPRNTPCIPAVNFFSALDLNKFPKNLKIECHFTMRLPRILNSYKTVTPFGVSGPGYPG